MMTRQCGRKLWGIAWLACAMWMTGILLLSPRTGSVEAHRQSLLRLRTADETGPSTWKDWMKPGSVQVWLARREFPSNRDEWVEHHQHALVLNGHFRRRWFLFRRAQPDREWRRRLDDVLRSEGVDPMDCWIHQHRDIFGVRVTTLPALMPKIERIIRQLDQTSPAAVADQR